MTYLLVQTLVWLLLAALLGFCVAWLLRGQQLDARLGAAQDELGNMRGRLQHLLDQDRDAAVAVEQLTLELHTQQKHREKQRREIKRLKEELQEALGNKDYEVEQLREELANSIQGLHAAHLSEQRLNDNYEALQRNIESVEGGVEQARLEAAALQQLFDAAGQKLSGPVREVQDLNQDEDGQDATDQSVLEEAGRMREENRRLRAKLDAFESERSDGVAPSANDVESQSQQEQQRLKAEVLRLEAALQKQRRQMHAADAEVRRLQQALQTHEG